MPHSWALAKGAQDVSCEGAVRPDLSINRSVIYITSLHLPQLVIVGGFSPGIQPVPHLDFAESRGSDRTV